MNYKKSDIQKWCNALRSGEYSQTIGQLQDSEGYCCLGVACKIFIKPEDQNTLAGYLAGGMPNSQPKVPEWLNDRFENSVVEIFKNKTRVHLELLNDEDGFTFDEIADLLEAVFIHEVLD